MNVAVEPGNSQANKQLSGRTLRNRLGELSRLLKSAIESSVPYVIIAEVGRDTDIPDLMALKMPGLLAAQQTKSDAVVNVTVYWRTREHYNLNAAVFSSSMPPHLVSFEGYLAKSQTKAKSWTEATWKEWLLAASAVWGAVTALVAVFPMVFAFPQADLQISIDKPDVYQDAKLAPKATIRNTGRFASLVVSEPTVYLSPYGDTSGKQEETFDVGPKKYTGLAPGVLLDLTVSRKDEPISKNPAAAFEPLELTPLKYQVGFSANIKAGEIWRATSFSAQAPARITLWRSNLSRQKPTLDGLPGPTIATFTGRIFSGVNRKQGARGVVAIERQMTIKQIQLACSPVACIPSDLGTSPDNFSHTLEFAMGEMTEFSNIQYKITVTAGQSLTPADWQDVSTNIKFRLE